MNKPRGITSSDAVAKVRRALSTRDVGHMGTLDPAGEGVLIMGVGKATRLFDYFLAKDKVYQAEFAFGYETDTLDGDGSITAETTNIPKKEQIEAALKNFVGVLRQLPPKYSAKNVDGRRAYDLARAGIDFELAAKEITVYAFRLLNSTANNTYKMEIHCSGGTYIRSLCRDLAHSLNSLATMVSICRIKCGKYNLSDSVTVDELANNGAECLISVEDALSDLPKLELGEEYYNKLCNGVRQSVNKSLLDVDLSGSFRLYCGGELFGIAQEKDGFIVIKSYLRD